ncbi:hypothetical protein ABLE91_26795 [Aquabacter sp. CN5-332]|uniref:hypothetical protein n=1 Tax=Aquabacter sp. CN5-332 TaxID=3156608 RepID=UPI0032B4A10A
MPSDTIRANERAVPERPECLERWVWVIADRIPWHIHGEAREAAWLEWEQSCLTATSLRSGDPDGFRQ